MKEEWRNPPGYPEYLMVSDLGRVFLKERPRHNSNKLIPARMVTTPMSQYGYHWVNLQIEGRSVRESVHRLVAKAFVGGYFEGAHVDHIDGNKTNNRADNLEWVTVQENTRRQWATGLNPGLYRGTNVTAKLTDLQVHAIQLLYENNFPPSLLAEWFDVSKSLIEKLGPKRRADTKLRSRLIPRLVA